MSATKLKSEFTKDWIIRNSIEIIADYGGDLTLRALHYRLVALGMTNDTNHYKKVVASMTDARWQGDVEFDTFRDLERSVIGSTPYEETNVNQKAEDAKYYIKYWANNYSKNRWENQPNYVEVWIEKKALQAVFEDTCSRFSVALCPCKGYPSLTFQYEAKKRFDEVIAEGKEVKIAYFGDYDCSGEDIPRSIVDTLERMGTTVELTRFALMEHQVVEWNLPPAPTKTTDSRGANWDGLGQVELDAVEPRQIKQMAKDAIESFFDFDLYADLLEQQKIEKAEYKEILKRDFATILD